MLDEIQADAADSYTEDAAWVELAADGVVEGIAADTEVAEMDVEALLAWLADCR